MQWPEKVWSVKPKSGKRHNAKTNLKLHSIVLLPVIQKFVDGLGRSLAILAAFIIGGLCLALLVLIIVIIRIIMTR